MNAMWSAALAGFAVAAVSAAIAWLALRWSASRPRLVVAAVLGGTMVRLILVAVASVLLLSFTAVHPVAYATALIVSYLAFLGVEIYLIARRAASRPATESEVP